MFLKNFIRTSESSKNNTVVITLVFLGTMFFQNVYAYKNEGVERINPHTTIKRADKEDLAISKHERQVKKSLMKLKNKKPKEFKKELSEKIVNDPQLQGYLLEIKEGLQKVEKAKKIAKYILYSKVKGDWDIIKTTALNTRDDETFDKFKIEFKEDVNSLYYIGYNNGYMFRVGLWGEVTVSKNLKNILWKVEFNSKYDNNRLEEGAENIEIQE